MTQENKPLQFVVTHPSELSASDILNYICEANADAPTWGEWVDADAIPKNIDDSFYEVEFLDGHTEFWTMKKLNGYYSKIFVGKIKEHEVKQFRRLKYTPKPAPTPAPPMPNQNECDHVVGDGGSCETVLVRMHDITVYPKIVKFNYCPDCGAKIDWDKIKEELLDDKHN